MHRRPALATMVLWVAAAWPPSGAQAQRAPAAGVVAADDAKAVRAVIEAQLAAFAADDAAAAFALAAPAIRAQFGDAATFMTMVRAGYPVVYRPSRVVFLVPEAVDDGVLQRVQMLDAAGAGWIASYVVQRQADRRWRIGGCVIERRPGQFT